MASLRHGTAEAIELVVHGDSTTSNVVGRQIGDIKLPVGAMIAAILRKNEVIIARRQVVIEEGDNVIVYINDKKSVSEIEKLFQPSAFFYLNNSLLFNLKTYNTHSFNFLNQHKRKFYELS